MCKAVQRRRRPGSKIPTDAQRPRSKRELTPRNAADIQSAWLAGLNPEITSAIALPLMSSESDRPNFDFSEPLALHGGPKAKRTPFPPRKRHGELEKRYLAEVIDS